MPKFSFASETIPSIAPPGTTFSLVTFVAASSLPDHSYFFYSFNLLHGNTNRNKVLHCQLRHVSLAVKVLKVSPFVFLSFRHFHLNTTVTSRVFQADAARLGSTGCIHYLLAGLTSSPDVADCKGVAP